MRVRLPNTAAGPLDSPDHFEDGHPIGADEIEVDHGAKGGDEGEEDKR